MSDLSATLKEHGLAREDYDRIARGLGREPNHVELGMFSVMWSEHCCYKSSKSHLKSLPTSGECVLQGPGENAGVVDVGDGAALVFKIESHNHPSFIEPFQGAATGSGGILRDIFTMGARPFALLDSLHFGHLTDARNRYTMRGVVSGISFYGNCIGVPTVGGQTHFADCYAKNPLVNVMCAGLARKDKVFLGAASDPGNLVIYAGSRTGRDGLHGATMASAAFDESSEERRPTVQVGDPFAEKLVMEACLELMDRRLITGIQDMGAAGLTCSTSEMAARGGTGIRIDLGKVPKRVGNLTPYEMMLSESQERMLLVTDPGRKGDVLEVFARWGVKASVVGVVTDNSRLVVDSDDQVVADIPLGLLIDDYPRCERPIARPPSRQQDASTLAGDMDLKEALEALVASPGQCDKRWIFEQYDHLIGTNTVVGPGADAALMRIKGTRKGIALTLDGNGAKISLDPYQGGLAAVAEAFINVSCVGARPLAVTNCLNFGNPEDPAVMWQFAEAVRGIKDACEFFDTPVTGGNVSFYNETLGEGIYPTPVIGMVGLHDDVRKALTPRFKAPGDVILLIGKTIPRLNGSQLSGHLSDELSGKVIPVDLEAVKRASDIVLELSAMGLLQSIHDCSDGGIAMTFLECCFGRSADVPAGARLRIPEAVDPIAWLFGESVGRIMVSMRSEDASSVTQLLARRGQEHLVLGEVRRDGLQIEQGSNVLARLEGGHLKQLWTSGLEKSIT